MTLCVLHGTVYISFQSTICGAAVSEFYGAAIGAAISEKLTESQLIPEMPGIRQVVLLSRQAGNENHSIPEMPGMAGGCTMISVSFRNFTDIRYSFIQYHKKNRISMKNASSYVTSRMSPEHRRSAMGIAFSMRSGQVQLLTFYRQPRLLCAILLQIQMLETSEERIVTVWPAKPYFAEEHADGGHDETIRRVDRTGTRTGDFFSSQGIQKISEHGTAAGHEPRQTLP